MTRKEFLNVAYGLSQLHTPERLLRMANRGENDSREGLAGRAVYAAATTMAMELKEANPKFDLQTFFAIVRGELDAFGQPWPEGIKQ